MLSVSELVDCLKMELFFVVFLRMMRSGFDLHRLIALIKVKLSGS